MKITLLNPFPPQTALGLVLSVSSFGIAAQAQAAAPAADALEEVVVTAEHRAVSVQDIPISAVALSGQALDSRGVKTFEELQYNVPSLTFTDNGNSKYVNIRGVGVSESAPNQTVGVAVHLDGGYVAREFVFGDALFDLDSVEVLRGPQGTYSGQNAAGGAIFINSKKPVIGKTDGFLNAELGNYKEQRVGGGATVSFGDTIALRLSGDLESRDSFYRNHGATPATDPGTVKDQPGNLSRSLGRAQLLYRPTDKLELRLIEEVSDVFTDGVPYKYFPAKGTNTLPTTGLRDLSYDLDGHRIVRYQRTTGKLDWQAADAFKVQATAAYLGSHQHYYQDTDRNTLVTPTTVQNGADYTINDHYWSAELNLVSTGQGPIEWTVGASKLDYEQNNYLNFLRYNNAQFPYTTNNSALNTRLYYYLDNIRKNDAVFGEIGYTINPQVQVKLGLRYNEDTVGFDKSSYVLTGSTPKVSYYNAPSGNALPAGLLDFKATTGRVLVNYRPIENYLIYGTISRGYKPGGTTPLANTYDSEKVTNYEVGWKADLLDKRLSAAVSAYYMKYDNFQRTYSPDPNNPAAALTNNVDGTTIKGFELQLSGLVGQMRWDFSYAAASGAYGSLNVVLPKGIADGVNPTAPTVFNLQGEDLDFLPKTTWNLGFAYQGLHLGNGKLVPSLRVSHMDEFYTSFYHYPYNLTPHKTLADAFLAYESDKAWRLEAYARNLTNKTYISRANGGSDAAGQYLLGAPRTVGVKFGYRF
jgi:iron complex outermembrane receptor protein